MFILSSLAKKPCADLSEIIYYSQFNMMSSLVDFESLINIIFRAAFVNIFPAAGVLLIFRKPKKEWAKKPTPLCLLPQKP